MEFDLDDFVEKPTIEKLDKCTKESLILIAEKINIPISKQVAKHVIKEQVCAALEKEGLLLTARSNVQTMSLTTRVDGAGISEQLRLRELVLEMRRIELREKEMEMELRKFEEETKRVVRIKELEVGATASLSAAQPLAQ